ncbi:MAG: hypothetical protein WCS56_03795, partial [Bacilli bacterium]
DVFNITSLGVIGVSAILLEIVFGSVELFFTFSLSNNICNNAFVTSEFPFSSIHPIRSIYPGKK